MKMRSKALPALILILAFLTGCTTQKPSAGIHLVSMYYCRKEADGSPGAPQAEDVNLGSSSVSPEQLLERYFSGPVSQELVSPFPHTMSCDYTLENGMLTLELSEPYALCTEQEQIVMDACLCLTLSQMENVDCVCVSCGTTSRQYYAGDFVLQDESSENPEYAVKLYFPNSGSRLSEERRTLLYKDKAELPELAMQALLHGPQDQMHFRVIPEETHLLDISVDEGICTVVFSDEFVQVDSSPQRSIAAVRSVVATLCALDGIDAVRVQMIDGSSLQHISIDEPIQAEERWIK